MGGQSDANKWYSFMPIVAYSGQGQDIRPGGRKGVAFGLQDDFTVQFGGSAYIIALDQ